MPYWCANHCVARFPIYGPDVPGSCYTFRPFIILHSHPLYVTLFFPACTTLSGKHGHGSPNTVNLDYPHYGTGNLVAIESVETTIRIISQGSGNPPASTVKNCTLIHTGTNKYLASVNHIVGNISIKEHIRSPCGEPVRR